MYGGDESTVPSAYEDLVKDFKERLELAAGGSPLVIFLDAIDQLSEDYNAKSLVWLPVSCRERAYGGFHPARQRAGRPGE